MRVLVDTNLLLWSAVTPERLSGAARALLEDASNDLAFSVASVWEVAIKQSLGRPDFRIDPLALRRGLVAAGYQELPILSEHAIAAGELPRLHGDPFDRMLVAQSKVEGLALATSDRRLADYLPTVRVV